MYIPDLNHSETAFLTIGLCEQLVNKPTPPTYFHQISLLPCLTLLLSAILESWSWIKNLTFADYITQLSRTCYMRIRDPLIIRPHAQ